MAAVPHLHSVPAPIPPWTERARRIPPTQRVQLGAKFFTAATGKPAVIGHRGSGKTTSAVRPPQKADWVQPPDTHPRENTMESMFAAIEAGATWVEFDVQLDADQELVVTHHVMHNGTPVAKLSTAEARSRGILTLRELHEGLPTHIGFHVDVKHSLADLPGMRDVDLFDVIGDWADQTIDERPLLLAAQCPSLLNVRREVPLGWLTSETAGYYATVASVVRLGASVAVVHAEDVRLIAYHDNQVEDILPALERYNVAVLAYGVRPEDVPLFVERGVSGMCGDDVPGLVEAVRNLQVEAVPPALQVLS